MANYFSIMLFVLTISTGLIWLLDVLLWKPKRKQKLEAAGAATQLDLDDEVKHRIAPQHPVAEFAESIFPVIAFVFVLRSFLYEPFQIPSGSMMPTLLVGDFILVEKYSYGIRNPVANSILLETDKPLRGDVAVFKYPENPALDYIKRVVALPGDRVIYRNKKVYILPNCQAGAECQTQYQEMQKELVSRGEFSMGPYPLDRFVEDLSGVKHDVLLNFRAPDMSSMFHKQASTSQNDEWIVPESHYFVLGDNRDNSTDSRFWGFVPENHLVGKAVFIWMSFEFERGEDDFLPSWVPSGVRFDRLGKIPGASEIKK
ncbi:signal peptidase I [Catenovulum maritimum]|uniref:Signal peptidase I n=1 Tax=Catenovulum maritimum TaxID=1513271 RepID=A0A0J8GUC0_9ALTE|nr:signal peptidase I [Catenovulum maritimum]KMT64288.1 signal peptidase [Catenovulum maritimum]